MSEIIETNNNSIVKFVDDNAAIQITGIPIINDPQNGFIQRIVKNQNGVQRSLFYVAGLTELGTIGAANYLVNNWKYLFLPGVSRAEPLCDGRDSGPLRRHPPLFVNFLFDFK